MKIAHCDLKKFAGKKVYCSEESRNGDLYQTYFTAPEEAIKHALDAIDRENHHYDPKKYTVTALYGTVDEDGIIDDSTTDEIPGWRQAYAKTLVKLNWDKVADVMRDAERFALKHTSCECRVYVDSEGDVDFETRPAGDSFYYTGGDREYFYAVDYSNFDIMRDYWLQGSEDVETFYKGYFNIDVDAREVHDEDGDEVEGLEEKLYQIAKNSGVSGDDLDAAIEKATAEAIEYLVDDYTTTEAIDDAIKQFLSDDRG